MLHEHVSIIYL